MGGGVLLKVSIKTFLFIFTWQSTPLTKLFPIFTFPFSLNIFNKAFPVKGRSTKGEGGFGNLNLKIEG